jgi:membrane protein DedA with SNARE-associated domain
MDAVNELIAQAAASPWVYLVVFAVVLVDAIFPPVPSESVVIAGAAAAAAVGQPSLPLLLLCAAAGAVAGDNLTFAIGRAVPLERLPMLRRPRWRAAFDRARQGVRSRAGLLILSARYIPVGRVAVNLVAGASGLSRRRFLLLSVLGGSSWALYSATLGVVAGHWLHGNALLAVVVGVAGGLVLGVAVDLVIRLVSRRRSIGRGRVETEDGSQTEQTAKPLNGFVGAVREPVMTGECGAGR